VDAIAAGALEMMMVRERRSLVTRRVSRQVDRMDRPFRHQQLERAVHRREPDRAHRRARRFQHLARRERSSRLAKRRIDGRTLTRLPHEKCVFRTAGMNDNDKPFSSVVKQSWARAPWLRRRRILRIVRPARNAVATYEE